MRRSKRIFAGCAVTLLLGGAEHAFVRGGQVALPAMAQPAGEVVAPPPPPPLELPAEPYFPFLSDEDPTASVSVGGTSRGWVVNARRLHESETCAFLPTHRGRDLSYGTREVVERIERASRALFAKTGTRLFVGNIGKHGGGDIPYSVSHDAGRDVDFALSYLDRAGKPVDPPDLIPLDKTGRNKTLGLRFDAARTWTVVRSLLDASGESRAEVQFIFLSKPLTKMLLDHARTQKEPPRIMVRAAATLKQPAGALPHDDHLHVRFYCTARDVEGGCENSGLVHPWVDLHGAARQRRASLAVAALSDPRPRERRRAVERLAILRNAAHLADIAARLEDEASEVREASALAIGLLGGAAELGAVAARYFVEPEARVKIALLAAARDVGGRAGGEFLREAVSRASLDVVVPPFVPFVASLLAPPSTSDASPVLLASLAADASNAILTAQPPPVPVDPVRLAAIDAAGRCGAPDPAGALVPLLSHGDGAVRERAADALSLLTNRSFGADWDAPEQDAATRDRAIAAWLKWMGAGPRPGPTRAVRPSHDLWLASGFLAAGYAIPRIDKKHVWELIRAVAGPDHVSHNALSALARISGHRPSPGGPSWGATTTPAPWPKREACRYWLRWFGARRDTFDLDRAPAKTLRACSG